MLQQLISRSSDLKKLRDEGYELEIRSNHLLIKNVPYLNSQREIKRGTVVTTLTLAGDKTVRPDNHVVYFIGEFPCNLDGSQNVKLVNQSGQINLGAGLVADHSFSAKPKENGGYYLDYYEKIKNYVAILSGPAQAIDPEVKANTFAVISTGEESVFNYLDTASSRASIESVTSKLRKGKIAIIGLGGTGSYILDLIAKTPVEQIHLFDKDVFLQHNAFRSPGAPTSETLAEQINKAEYFGKIYSNMRKGIFVHSCFIENSNVEKLKEMTFVFICIDDGEARKMIVRHLEEYGVPFIDVGMGVYLVDDKLGGIVRTTVSTNEQRDHVNQKNRIPFDNSVGINEYNKNIQIADLNALNAVLAVMKWKKLMGFYLDLEKEFFSTYTIDGNHLINEDNFV